MFQESGEENFITCPFNTAHRVVAFRMHRHILKCRKNYRGPPLEMCAYNAYHWVPEDEMPVHLEKCVDCHSFHQSKYVDMAKGSALAEI